MGHSNWRPAVLRTVLFAVAGALACSGLQGEGAPAEAKEPPADRIYLGEVVTVDPESRIAQGVGIKDGRVLVVGDEAAVLAHRGRQTEVVDLAGAALLPGFIDAHSHLMGHAVALTGWANVSQPPVGGVTNIPELLAELQRHKRARGLRDGDWLVGYGYDREGLTEGREVTRSDLDARFPDNPVALIHVSSHGAVLNSAALEEVGIGADTRAPPGGQIVRQSGTNAPTGLLLEAAFFQAAAVFMQPSGAESADALRDAQLQYAAKGYTTIQDGATNAGSLATLRAAAQEERLFLDVVALPVAETFREIAGRPDAVFGGDYRNHLKLGGVKTWVDGAPQAATAYFTKPMLVRGPNGQRRWTGEPLLPQNELDDLFRLAYRHDAQPYVHANGDAAIDMFLAAHEAAGAPAGRRPVVIHSQFVRPEQLTSYARIGAVPSFFPSHAFFWGDVHVRNLGAERAAFLSPLRSAATRGLHFTIHSDYAVTPLDPMFLLWVAIERTSRSGAVIGPAERVGIDVALRSITLDAAYQYFEEAEKGSIEPGKLADFAILDRNPLTTPVAELRDIEVIETVKEGETVWQAQPGAETEAP